MKDATTHYPRNLQNGEENDHDADVITQISDAATTEINLLQEMLLARRDAGLTQARLADKMGTKASAVARMELALSGNQQYATPTIATLKKYALAVNCSLEIHLVPNK